MLAGCSQVQTDYTNKSESSLETIRKINAKYYNLKNIGFKKVRFLADYPKLDVLISMGKNELFQKRSQENKCRIIFDQNDAEISVSALEPSLRRESYPGFREYANNMKQGLESTFLTYLGMYLFRDLIPTDGKTSHISYELKVENGAPTIYLNQNNARRAEFHFDNKQKLIEAKTYYKNGQISKAYWPEFKTIDGLYVLDRLHAKIYKKEIEDMVLRVQYEKFQGRLVPARIFHDTDIEKLKTLDVVDLAVESYELKK